MSGITEYAVADIFDYIEKVYAAEHIAESPCHSENLVLIKFFFYSTKKGNLS
jgi:hypothetical protein